MKCKSLCTAKTMMRSRERQSVGWEKDPCPLCIICERLESVKKAKKKKKLNSGITIIQSTNQQMRSKISIERRYKTFTVLSHHRSSNQTYLEIPSNNKQTLVRMQPTGILINHWRGANQCCHHGNQYRVSSETKKQSYHMIHLCYFGIYF